MGVVLVVLEVWSHVAFFFVRPFLVPARCFHRDNKTSVVILVPAALKDGQVSAWPGLAKAEKLATRAQ